MSDDTTSRFNQVQLVGRLAADAVHRELPSGDRMATFRLVIDRPEGGVGPRVDTIDCAVWRGGPRPRPAGGGGGGTPSVWAGWRAARRRRLGGGGGVDVLGVEGEPRRRFWGGGAGVGSRYEV